jgi:two-component system phosphate regulon response regulator PhoB
MNKYHVMVIDGDPDTAALIGHHMEEQGYLVTKAGTGDGGYSAVLSQVPHVVILDTVLPGIGGFDLLRKLKQNEMTREIPVVVLSTLRDETDVIVGLELGADEYLIKPFSPRILTAKVRALLRKTYHAESPDSRLQLHFEQLTLDSAQHQVLVQGRPVALSILQFSILKLLMMNPGSVFSRAEIIATVRGHRQAVTERSVDVHIVGLRRSLGPEGDYIETIRGVGYRLGIHRVKVSALISGARSMPATGNRLTSR